MKRFVFLFIFCAPQLYGKEPIEAIAPVAEPIFAGTLLAGTPVNTPPGSWLLEPYLLVTHRSGLYTPHWSRSHQPEWFDLQLLWDIETGITPWLDFTLYTSESYSSYHGRQSYLFGDVQVQLGFQICENQKDTWIPDVRIMILENFPSGKYRHLDPKKQLADVAGSGSFETWLLAVIREIYNFSPGHSMTANLTLEYDFPSNVHAEGHSFYGSGSGAVKPGRQFIANLAFEYSMTLYWMLGLDIHYAHQNKNRSSRTTLKSPSSEQFSLAPCIEYNRSLNFGVEAGAWFTVAGRNSASFVSGVLTVYWYF